MEKVFVTGAAGFIGSSLTDRLLADGILLFGIAVDDAHNFKDPGNPAVAGPGRGWVMASICSIFFLAAFPLPSFLLA